MNQEEKTKALLAKAEESANSGDIEAAKKFTTMALNIMKIQYDKWKRTR